MEKTELLDLLAEVAGTDEVRTNPDLDLFGTQVIDSMRVVELIVGLDERFGLVVSPADLDRDHWATPAQWVADIQARAAITA